MTPELPWIAFGALAFHALGLCAAIHAIMKTRSTQGAIAWALSLITWPYVSLPLYLVIGKDKFSGYMRARKFKDARFRSALEDLVRKFAAHDPTPGITALERLSGMRFTQGNAVRLLVDGEATYEAMFDAIAQARGYLLIQFYIFRDDSVGQAFKARILERAAAGVQVYFIYDALGSHGLARRFLQELESAGVRTAAFRSTRGLRSHIQLNFRNHRKIVIVDGHTGFLGGHNVGVEYLGLDPRLGPWRDTHVEIRGAAVLQAQLCFLEDWHWACDDLPSLRWDFPAPHPENHKVLIYPSGPADALDNCALFFAEAIQSAKHRVWISTPYFVPDAAILSALHLAIARGVDVRILMAGKSDNIISKLATQSYIPEIVPHGIRVFKYRRGFLHKKVLLVDSGIASVGSANFDNRSFRLNFEVSALVLDEAFARSVEAMLMADFARSEEVQPQAFEPPGRLMSFASRLARLTSPLL